jgi:SAM-dependent methyltransferase
MLSILVLCLVLVQFKFDSLQYTKVHIAGERTGAVGLNKSSNLVATNDVSATSKGNICFSRRSGGDGCGPHGSCLIDRCICDPFFDGERCTEERKMGSRCFDKLTKDDKCMNTLQGYGRLKVASQNRMKIAQKCETGFWEKTQVPKRNSAQVVAFNQFRQLPIDLGHVLEIGAGPYTKIRLLLEAGGDKNRTIKSATLVDPLIHEYISNPKVMTSYSDGKLCVQGSCIETILKSSPGEEFLPFQQYDMAILVNTLEHCENAVKVLDNVYQSLKPGGILMFGESVTRRGKLKKTMDCHPIQVTRKFFVEYLRAFKGKTLMPLKDGKGIIKNNMFAIVRKQGEFVA